jgi:hypothetical protein
MLCYCIALYICSVKIWRFYEKKKKILLFAFFILFVFVFLKLIVNKGWIPTTLEWTNMCKMYNWIYHNGKWINRWHVLRWYVQLCQFVFSIMMPLFKTVYLYITYHNIQSSAADAKGAQTRLQCSLGWSHGYKNYAVVIAI